MKRLKVCRRRHRRRRRLYLLSSHVSSTLFYIAAFLCVYGRIKFNSLRTTSSSLLSSQVSTYRTNCTYEKASVNIEAKYGTDLRGNCY
jgi:hypothetical protein